MIDLRLSEVSASAGPAGDGVLRGRIDTSAPLAELHGSVLLTIEQVLRRDVTAAGSVWTDLTAVALDATSTFQPWGATGSMSAGDAVYLRVAGNEPVRAIYAELATAGVGAWSFSVSEWDEAAEAWRAVGGLVDPSSALRAAPGTYRISYESGARGQLRLEDQQGKHRWVKVELASLASASVAPVLRRVWAAGAAIALAAAVPAEEVPTVGLFDVTVHPAPPTGEDATVTRARVGAYSIVREYLSSDGYKPIPDVSDPSNGYLNTGTHRVRWTLPGDWVSRTIADRTGATFTGWVQRTRVTAVATEGVVAPPLVTRRSVAFGAAARGIYLAAATTIRALTYDVAGTLPTADVRLALYVAATGRGVTVTLPAGVRSSADLAAGRLDVGLEVPAGGSVVLVHLGGGSLSDAEVRLVT